MSNAYDCGMVARLITLLAIFAITVVTTVTSAHAVRMDMGSGADHAMHAGDMMHATDNAGLGCDPGQHCGSTDAEMCDFVCAGLSAFLTAPVGDAGHVHGPARHALPSEAIHVSRAHGLTERPPKHRLL